MTMFSIYFSKKSSPASLQTSIGRWGAAFLCCAVLFSGCAPHHEATDEAPVPSHQTEFPQEDTTASVPETLPVVETGIILTEPQETVDMSSMMEEASITVKSRDGVLGDYDFFTCNETQLFGDFSISLAEYAGEEYLMLSYNGIALLAKEDGSDAMIFYNEKCLELPFPCYFNLDSDFLALHPGDFSGKGSYQLALVIPMASGSGLAVQQLQVIDLETMSVMPIHTEDETYTQDMTALFDTHFEELHPGISYQLFQYVQYHIEDGLIFVEYGACDEDGNYLCFLNGSLICHDDKLVLDQEISFQNYMY